MREQINPIQDEQRDDNGPEEISLRGRDMRNPQARRTCDQNDQRIKIKDRQCAERGKNERVPAQSSQKVAMQKLSGRSGCAAGQARTAGEIMKHAARPRQAEREPSRHHRQRAHRDAQPDSFVIKLTGRKPAPRDLHQNLLMLRCAPGANRAKHHCQQ
jgi:hypothetical protein